MNCEQILAAVEKTRTNIWNKTNRLKRQIELLDVNPIASEINALQNILNNKVFKNVDVVLSRSGIKGVQHLLCDLETKADKEIESATQELWEAIKL